MNALELFRMGNDYAQVAAYLKTTEAEIEKIIHDLRTKERVENYRSNWKADNKDHVRSYMREYKRRQRAEIRNARADR